MSRQDVLGLLMDIARAASAAGDFETAEAVAYVLLDEIDKEEAE